MPVKRFDIEPLEEILAADTTVLVPNHRLRDALIDGVSQIQTTTAWLAPPIFAIDIWLKQIWQRAAMLGISPFSTLRILEAEEEQLLWITVIEETLQQVPLLNPEDFAQSVSQAYQVCQLWLGEPEKVLSASRGISEIPMFLHWCKTYRERCKDTGCISLVDAVALLNSGTLAQLLFLPVDICLVNFDQTPPLYSRFFATLSERVHLHSVTCNQGAGASQYQRFEFEDAAQEFKACAHWADKMMRAEPEAHIGIILPGRLTRQAELERALKLTLDPDSRVEFLEGPATFNSSVSLNNLLDTPVIADAFLILQLNHDQVDSSDVCRLLHSPHLLAFEEEGEARISLEGALRERLSARCNISTVLNFMGKSDKPWHCPKLLSAILALRTSTRGRAAQAPVSDWITLLQQQLLAFGWPGKETHLTEIEKNALRQWDQMLTRLAQMPTGETGASLSVVLSRVKWLCKRTPAQQRFNNRCQLSLYTIGEATGIAFDHIWLLGFDDQAWPSRPAPSAFIPFAMQIEAGIPGSNSDIQYELSRHYFKLISHATNGSVTASHHRLDEDRELRPSSFIQPFPPGSGGLPDVNVEGIDEAGEIPVSVQFEWTNDLTSFPLDVDNTCSGGQEIISNQSACPFRAFAKHRLQAKHLEPFENGLSARARGTAVHIALENLYQHIDSLSTLAGLDDITLQDHIETATETALQYLSRQHADRMTSGFRRLEKQRIEQLLQNFLELEGKRDDFKVLSREKKLSWQHENLQLNLKIDRIDQLADGSLVLIDYKSGRKDVRAPQSDDARPEDMQLAVYYTVHASADENDIHAVVVGHTNIAKIDYSGVATGEGLGSDFKRIAITDEEDWEILTQSWQSKTQQFATEFVNGLAPVSPARRSVTCRYCNYQALCRVNELDQSLERLLPEDGGS